MKRYIWTPQAAADNLKRLGQGALVIGAILGDGRLPGGVGIDRARMIRPETHGKEGAMNPEIRKMKVEKYGSFLFCPDTGFQSFFIRHMHDIDRCIQTVLPNEPLSDRLLPPHIPGGSNNDTRHLFFLLSGSFLYSDQSDPDFPHGH